MIPTEDISPTRRGRSTALGLTALALVSLLPLLIERPPVDFLMPRDALDRWVGGLLVAGLLLAAVGWRWLSDRETGEANTPRTLTFLAAAGAMTACHWLLVDQQPLPAAWQPKTYLQILNHTCDRPHQYRPLPYGFIRLLEWLARDWLFACLAYRCFFNYWLLWAWYRFACLFHAPGPAAACAAGPLGCGGRAALTLLPFVALYPCSVAFYLGQLTDPLSHTLFVLGFTYIIEDRPLALAAALALGMLAKETAVLLVPCWFVCHAWNARRTWVETALLGAAATAALLAARLPFGWRPGAEEMNGAGLMVGTNLGIGRPIAFTTVPLYQCYVQPLLFIVPFLPFIAWNWRTTDVRLRLLAVTLTPLLLASSLCFGWLYESRNYVPLLPLLTTMALRTGAGYKFTRPLRSREPLH
jgi:hypothetical protein